ncbi:MAG: hypothetical protein MK172_07245 [Verrucomicrobiales bacterium]|nr:hypothetical protein [Verrucomicrobiales bacterium]
MNKAEMGSEVSGRSGATPYLLAMIQPLFGILSFIFPSCPAYFLQKDLTHQ